MRALALRSAAAAKEIGGLVRATGVSIGEGVKLVNETGEQLRAIGERVTLVDEHVRVIAQAAHQQASGLTQVASAIAELDRDTSAAAAMVQNVNASGADLASDSAELADMMGRFQIGDPKLSRTA